MELQYRGITYTPTTEAIDTSDSSLTGCYRGQVVIFKTSQPQTAAATELTYRGITYNPRTGERVVNSRLTLQLLRTRSRRHPAFRSC